MTPEQEQELQELRTLREEVRALRALVDNVTQGGNAMKAEAMSVAHSGEAVMQKVFNPWTQHGRVVDIAASVHGNAARAHKFMSR